MENVKIKDFIITPEIWEEIKTINSSIKALEYINKNNLSVSPMSLYDYCVLNGRLLYSELIEYTNNKKCYSKEDIDLIITTIANNPHNLYEDFRILGPKLKKLPLNIRDIYYRSIKPKLTKKNAKSTDKIFFIKGNTNKYTNYKNITNQDTKVLSDNFVLTPYNLLIDDKVIINNNINKPYIINTISRTYKDLITITLVADYGRKILKRIIYYSDNLQWHDRVCGKNKAITLTQYTNG